MTARKPPVKVEPGQIWADTYHGNKGRTVRIISLDGRHAVTSVATEADQPWASGTTIGRRSRVLYDDRGLRGYRLVTKSEMGVL